LFQRHLPHRTWSPVAFSEQTYHQTHLWSPGTVASMPQPQGAAMDLGGNREGPVVIGRPSDGPWALMLLGGR